MSSSAQPEVGSTVQVYFKPNVSYTLSSSSGAHLNCAVRNLIEVREAGANADESHPLHGKRMVQVIYHAQLYSTSAVDQNADEKPIDVALKWATGMRYVDLLLKEARFYEDQLKSLQGIAVPEFYGFYVGRVNDIDIGCLLIEWCDGEPHLDLWERNRQKLLAAARIHRVRVCHGRLSDDEHFVVSSKDNTMRIVNFSHASLHHCPGGTPLMLNPADSKDTPEKCSFCPELALLEETYGPDTGQDGYRLRQANGLYHSSWFDPWM
ncbi:hypothetical protein EVJ58_g1700 [Rhodofomes roseus]|uniref:Uncharacterized protein n=1 Tax=Rhodofomes roseus TaxID=34475 RepID=A0A4Y9Z090_9APHY|nr:hypothetical protein EVJ58_g1700 [Rhodofomes roseus]